MRIFFHATKKQPYAFFPFFSLFTNENLFFKQTEREHFYKNLKHYYLQQSLKTKALGVLKHKRDQLYKTKTLLLDKTQY